MTVLDRFDSILIFLALTGAAAALEHMAFRGPAWQRRQQLRHAIGVQTVLLLALLPIWDGDAELATWLMVQAGFMAYGAVKLAAGYLDRLRRDALQGALLNASETTD